MITATRRSILVSISGDSVFRAENANMIEDRISAHHRISRINAVIGARALNVAIILPIVKVHPIVAFFQVSSNSN